MGLHQMHHCLLEISSDFNKHDRRQQKNMATLKPAKDKTKNNLVHTEFAKESTTPSSEAHSL
jgi:hypothetical protein